MTRDVMAARSNRPAEWEPRPSGGPVSDLDPAWLPVGQDPESVECVRHDDSALLCFGVESGAALA